MTGLSAGGSPASAHARDGRLELAFRIHQEQRARDHLLALLQAVEHLPVIVGPRADLDFARFQVMVRRASTKAT